MTQTIMTVAFEVQPASVGLLEQSLTDFRTRQETPPGGGPSYVQLSRDVPTLHFMSIMVFRDATYDPLFLLEVNFDGSAEAFWPMLVAASGPDIISMLRFCSPPRDAAASRRFADLLNTGQGLASVLATASVRPTAFHLGNRGLSRAQIVAEAALFDRVQATLNADDASFRATNPVQVHSALRQRLAPDFGWLAEASPPRIAPAENRSDWVNILVFATMALAVLALPGTILALILPWWFAAFLGIAAAVVTIALRLVPNFDRLLKSRVTQAVVMAGAALLTLVSATLWLGLAAFALFVLNLASQLVDHGASMGLGEWMLKAWHEIVAGAAAAPSVLLSVLFWLRRTEMRDGTSSAPVLDPELARLMAEREDRTKHAYQNHMGSIVMVKPGGLRSLLLRVGHHALHLALRVTPASRAGYLSDMRTVHFAHWALLNNNSRLLFMSNFDGTWDSYLDDFIEKAHAGTTLAWTNCVGSPLAAFLLLDGVAKGRQFKQWARCSMSANLFWFSAYPLLTVNQIERNHVIAEGLRQPALDAGSASQWIRSL